jgi:antitoxin component of RelBE/YafQ-DinJ toxin-antitoxin module
MVAMPERIRFHLDENVSHAVAAGLRRRGLDITTAVEIGLRAASDEEQLAFAFSQG